MSLGIDLHMHTTASDGELTPSELMTRAKDNDAKMIAITDHDTISGALSVADNTQGMTLVSGVEISTTWQGMGLHIVGLDFDFQHPAMQSLLKMQSQARKNRSLVILDKLSKVNMPITEEQLYEHAGHEHIGRPHIAQLMLKLGYVSSIDKAFKKYLGAGKMGDVKNQWVELSDAITAIKASHGLAVIAHPNHYKMTRSKLNRCIDDFVEMGGQGLEVISGKQHVDVTMRFAHLANEKNLYASLGSDFHRPMSYSADVGTLPDLPESVTPVWEAFSG